jgi:thiosulfate dehydrogenase [quinone] large subunit
MTLSRGAVVAVVALRVLIGWHFLYEGLAKLGAPGWSAAGYLQQARGPLAGAFKALAADPGLLPLANQATIWGLIAVGLGLMLGCFTRLASASGILLIAMFYLCNPPFVGYFYSAPSEGSYLVVNKNLVELAALAVVLTTRSGRVAGLDRLLHGIVRRPRRAGAAAAPALANPPLVGRG